VHDRLMALAAELTAAGERPAPPCPDPVNAAMIRNWTQALGDHGSRWTDTAPPAMIQVWSMPGLDPDPAVPGTVAGQVLTLLDDAGFTGVVATDCEQTYDRYLRHGERLRSTTRFGGVTGPKRTGLGEGYFVTWHQAWYSGGERVAEMMFRVLKFRPRAPGGRAAEGRPFRPAIGPDTRFFWDGARDGELRVQRCAECGRLRHPPGPMCPACHATEHDHVVANGRGTVHSYVVHHHPPVPGRTPPFVVALVDLEEGVRVVGNLLDCPPGQVRIGMPVELVFEQVDEELTLPQWRPAGAPRTPEPEAAAPEGLPALSIELTPTFVIATALATRDFTPVHHDVALARAQGATDIFLNILTTMGLIQRYVLERLPDAVIQGISVRLGAPAYAGDTLTLTGRVVDDRTVRVRGAVAAGDHAVAAVRIEERA
jgi:uncharacterized protein